MKNLTILLILLFLTISMNAQTTPPSIQWQRCLGGTKSDIATSIHQTIDGGYIVAGGSCSNDGDVTGHHGDTAHDDFWVVKLDTSVNIQWEKSLGGTLNDVAMSILQTSDRGYIVAGSSESTDGDVTGHHGVTTNWDYWVVKLDTSGNIQWQKTLGGSGYDFLFSIQQTKDGGYIVAGVTESNDGDVTGNHFDYVNNIYSDDFWVVKLDSSGNIQWEKCLGGSLSDGATSIQQTSDGGYIVAGGSSSNDGDVSGNNGNNDYWVVKLNSSGNIQWQKCLGGINDEYLSSVRQTYDGGYIVAGFTESNDGDVSGNHDTTGYSSDYWIVKLDTVGNILWQKCLGGAFDDRDASALQINDSSYIVGGYTMSNLTNDGDITGNHGNNDSWFVKLDLAGNIQWQKCLGGTGLDGNYGYSFFQQTQDGGYIIANGTSSNNGDVSGNHGGLDYWIVKLGPAPLNIKEQKEASKVSIYPNPANRNFTVNIPDDTKYIEISNSLGQVLEKRLVVHQAELNFNIKENGIYFVQIVTDKETITKKIIINNE